MWNTCVTRTKNADGSTFFLMMISFWCTCFSLFRTLKQASKLFPEALTISIVFNEPRFKNTWWLTKHWQTEYEEHAPRLYLRKDFLDTSEGSRRLTWYLGAYALMHVHSCKLSLSLSLLITGISRVRITWLHRHNTIIRNIDHSVRIGAWRSIPNTIRTQGFGRIVPKVKWFQCRNALFIFICSVFLRHCHFVSWLPELILYLLQLESYRFMYLDASVQNPPW